jgi:hypothetical protein
MSKSLRLGLASLMAVAVLGVSAPAFASGGGGGVTNSGPCSAASVWKIKASPEGARVEAQFEVDSGIAGQTWQVKLLDNGITFFRGMATTGTGGSFVVRRFSANQAGSDTIKGLARNQATGETCKGSVTL